MGVLQEKEKDIGANEATTGSESNLYRAKRDLLFRDGVTFFVLMVATVVLYAATSFLFGSFQERRADHARDYTARGKAALRANDPEEAIAALRTALFYAPDDRGNHLLLAEALAQANHTEEAISYFQTLRETEPADGLINLELARLFREKKDRNAALEYYRAASLGTWDGDSLQSRRMVQMELADTLIQSGDLAAARAEILLTAAGTPETGSLDVLFGDKLQQAQDPADALTFYRKAIQQNGHDVEAMVRAGRLLYRGGRFADAYELLDRAWRQEPKTPQGEAEEARVKALAEDAERIQQMTVGPDLSPELLAKHLRTDAGLARARLQACVAQNGAGADVPPAWRDLMAEWQATGKRVDRRAPAPSGPDAKDLQGLIFRTEVATSQQCGALTGDDALLLQLARAHAAQ